MSEEERFDGLFLTLAQQCQGIEPLLDALFSFLRRKTDFYAGASPAQVEKLVLDLLRKHSSLSERTQAEKKREREKDEARRKERERKKRMQEEKEQKERMEKERAAAPAPTPTTAAGDLAPKQDDDVIEMGADGSFELPSAAQATPAVPATPQAPPQVPQVAEPMDEKNEEEEEDTEKEDKVPPPPGNGGITDRYVWTQTLAECNVVVPVPVGTVARAVTVDISHTKLKVGLKGQPPIIDAPLHKRVKVDDSFWTLEDNREICINLQKENNMEWWKCVCVGDPEIDTTKVQPENSQLTDLDSDTRQTVEKMMFDQRQKAMGKPTSDELQKREMLDKFMKAHPEMDFSNAKIT